MQWIWYISQLLYNDIYSWKLAHLEPRSLENIRPLFPSKKVPPDAFCPSHTATNLGMGRFTSYRKGPEKNLWRQWTSYLHKYVGASTKKYGVSTAFFYLTDKHRPNAWRPQLIKPLPLKWMKNLIQFEKCSTSPSWCNMNIFQSVVCLLLEKSCHSKISQNDSE